MESNIDKQIVILATRQTAIQNALFALISTHPAPAAFASQLESLTANSQIEQSLAGAVVPLARDELRAYTQDFLALARHLAERDAGRREPPANQP